MPNITLGDAANKIKEVSPKILNLLLTVREVMEIIHEHPNSPLPPRVVEILEGSFKQCERAVFGEEGSGE